MRRRALTRVTAVSMTAVITVTVAHGIGAPAYAAPEAIEAKGIVVAPITSPEYEYRVRDAWTDNRLWNVRLPAVEPKVNTRDDTAGFEWRPAAPWHPERAIGRLFSLDPARPPHGDDDGTCTATVVARDVIVTAAHCVYAEDRWRELLYFVPGYRDDLADPSQLRTRPGWVVSHGAITRHYAKHADDQKPSWRTIGEDQAMLRVLPYRGVHVGDAVGMIDIAPDTNGPRQATVLGYPWESPLGYRGPAWQARHLAACAGAATRPPKAPAEPFHAWFIPRCALGGGASGGPWMIQDTDGGPAVIGVVHGANRVNRERGELVGARLRSWPTAELLRKVLEPA